MDWIKDNPLQAMIAVAFLIVVVVGGALVLFDAAGSLSFAEYTERVAILAGALGLLGVGKGILKSGHGDVIEDDIDDYPVSIHGADDDQTGRGPAAA